MYKIITLILFCLLPAAFAGIGDSLDNLKSKYGEFRILNGSKADRPSGLPYHVFKKDGIYVAAVMHNDRCIKIKYVNPKKEKFEKQTSLGFLALNKEESAWGYKINPKSLRQIVAQAQKEKNEGIQEALKKGYELLNNVPKDSKELEKRLKEELKNKMADYEKRKKRC